jgi:hypothetical protein
MNKRATKCKSAPENSILKFPTVSSMSSVDTSVIQSMQDASEMFNLTLLCHVY